MNDIYLQDRNNRNEYDFEGCGVGSGHYFPCEELKEKLEEIKLPMVLLIFAFLSFGLVLFLTFQEVNLYFHGTKAIASISGNRQFGIFSGDDGYSHRVEVGWANVKATDTEIVYVYEQVSGGTAYPEDFYKGQNQGG